MKKLTIVQDEPNKKTRVKRPIRLFTNPVQKGEKNNITLKILQSRHLPFWGIVKQGNITFEYFEHLISTNIVNCYEYDQK